MLMIDPVSVFAVLLDEDFIASLVMARFESRATSRA